MIFSGLVLLLILVLENINVRFWLSDFKVYYGAAEAFVKGDRVYGTVFGEDTGLYKYSPFLLFLFAPATLLPFQQAAVTHYLICSVFLVALFPLTYRLVTHVTGTRGKHPSLQMSIVFVVILNHVFRELHLGNVNIIMDYLLVLAAWMIVKGQEGRAGWIFALCVFFKPYFLLLSLALLLGGKIRSLLHAAMAALTFLLCCVIFMGWSDAVWMHSEWIQSMRNHSEFLDSFNNISAIVRIFFHVQWPLVLPVLLLSGILLFLWRLRVSKAVSTDMVFILSWMVLLALIPLLVITDTNHFVLSAPLILLVLLLAWHSGNISLMVFVTVAFLMYGANSPEIFGSHLSDEIEHHGVLGISNLMVILAAFWSVFNYSRREGKLSI